MENDGIEIWRIMCYMGIGSIFLEFLTGKNIFLAVGMGCFICGGAGLITDDKKILCLIWGLASFMGYFLFYLIGRQKNECINTFLEKNKK